ncbi:MAG: S41 family peptidase [Maricaulis sp.]|nr:S41 family peptidase [Maricaulis sp.]
MGPITLGLAALLSVAIATEDDGRLTAEQAREEVELVYEHVTTSHPDPFWWVAEPQWQARRDALLQREGPVTQVAQYFALASLMSLATDTHVQIYPDESTPGFETTYPLRFRVFEDGLFITAADDPYRHLVGHRIETIGGAPVADVLDTIAQYAFIDNDLRKRSWAAAHLLIAPATYQHHGWAAADGRVELETVTPSGERQLNRLDSTIDQSSWDVQGSGYSEGYHWPVGWLTLDDLSGHETLLSRSRLDENYWYTDLDDGRIVYFQFNTSSDQDGGETFAQFTMTLFNDLMTREQAPERLIIDVRQNLGGWIGRSLAVSYLAQISEFCCQRGSVVMLIGRETISAGSVFAGVNEVATRSIAIGEPTGGRPNIYIGHEGFELPYSQLNPEVSAYLYIGTDTADRRHFVAPDIAEPERFSDVMAGRDMALERAMSLTQEEADSFYQNLDSLRPWERASQQPALMHTE